ncbi:L,D-transpeptidase family protein [Streptomyces sp. CRN 30]|uniref:L,D-transpeptidase family protein n=1 Tax=Streptomyces sp. CRN 30 TaxID=3075613 RepID=UPI002A7FBE33|nr:L,D-transpeptidase family protein [Streptomyces sp. CRN 30]
MRLYRPLLPAAAALAVAAAGIAAYPHLSGDDHAAVSRWTPVAPVAPVASDVPAASDVPEAPVTSPATVRARPELPARLPGLGPRTRARIPASTRQVVLVTGSGRDAATSRAVLWQRVTGGWRAGQEWAAHNGYRGWTDRHHAGDLRSPTGVFGLSDAGGRLPDPGTGLPYHRSGAFSVSGTGFEGEPLSGAFDYVIAIDYNRQPGTSPMDGTRPLGADRGGGIWIHVDHGGPTHACVSLSEAHMRQLLRTLDPADHPVVVMGDAAFLAR